MSPAVNARDVDNAKRSAKLTGLQIRVVDELGRSPSYCEALADDLEVPSKRLNANLHTLERKGYLTSWIVTVPLSSAGVRSVRMWRPLTERERLERRVDERRNLWLSNRALELMRPRYERMLELHGMMKKHSEKHSTAQRSREEISTSPGK